MSKNKVAIIGAGIQGVCNALFLQKKGIDVTLFDKDEPGCAASYGNAGHFSPYASLQLNRSDVLSDVPAMLLSSRGPLALKWNYFVKMIPWFSKYIMSCSEKKMMHTAKYMHQILDISLDAYDELFADINLDGLVEKKGIMLGLLQVSGSSKMLFNGSLFNFKWNVSTVLPLSRSKQMCISSHVVFARVRIIRKLASCNALRKSSKA